MRPLCGRCSKGNRSCTWDADGAQGLTFKSEISFAQGNARRPRAVKNASQVSKAVALVAVSHPALFPDLTIPLEVHAVNYWSEKWVSTINNMPRNAFEDDYGSYAVLHWNHARPDSCLRLAFLAFTHAVFGRGKWSNLAIENANKYYCNALTSLRVAMKDLNKVATEDIDQLLITTMLMASFEVYFTTAIVYPSVADNSLESNVGKSSTICCDRRCRISLLSQHLPLPRSYRSFESTTAKRKSSYIASGQYC